MRLLHLDDSEKLIWTDFSGNTIPPYAILSHRWGDDEVLYEDLAGERYRSKTGYQKINFCARRSTPDLRYFWIDTCCIDRLNRPELSRAINSMFCWYRNASRCCVLLSDVSVSSAMDAQQQSTWEASFRASKWFTRGWTLQELIAPKSVDFFSLEGHRLGDKASLEQLVHEITGVPIEALQGRSLEDFDIHNRMAWARNRETSEPEDSAYCLLGLLNVSMLTTYGEGKERALSRLRNELESDNTTLSTIPFFRNHRFVGQELQLAQLEAKLFGDRQTAVLAITGAGGTGKSQLALELAYRTQRKYKSCSVFWINASDMDSLQEAYFNIAQKLDIPGWEGKQVDIKLLVKLYLSRKGARQWLLVFDNVDDVKFGSIGLPATRSASLIDYIPQSPMGSVVFTTTNSDVAEAVARQNVVELREMTLGTAQRMLEMHLDFHVPASGRTEMELLLRELSCLPLQVVQAAAYINTTSASLGKYQSQLVIEREKHLELTNQCSGEKLRDSSTRNYASPTTLVALDYLRNNYPLAAEYLFLMASVDRKDVPLDFLGTISSREREDTIRILGKYALVTRRPAESSLDLHRLVHLTIRDWLRSHGLVQIWTQKAVERLLLVFPNNDHWSRSRWRRVLPHARCALSESVTGQEDKARTTLVWRCARALYSDGCYDESGGLFIQAMETMKRVLGEEHPIVLAGMANLAATYQNQGRWKEAKELELKVMETRVRVLGGEHPDTLSSVTNLAATYRTQGRWKEAEELEVTVMDTRMRVLGGEHPETLTSMANLASTYWKQGRWKEAEELEVTVMDTRMRVLGGEHPETLTSMANLASIYRNQGRWKEAEELEVKVMETTVRVLGGDHPDTLTSMANLALNYRDQGRWNEAEGQEVKVMEARARLLGDEHPDTLTSVSNLASTYWNQGRWKEAEDLQTKVMETSSRVLGDEHPDTLTSVANLASTYRNQGRWKEAEDLQTKGRWKEAEDLQTKVMETRVRVLSSEHPSTMTIMVNLALTYQNQGRWEEAEVLQVRVMETSRRVRGGEHPDTLASIANVALTQCNQGRWKEAEDLQTKVMEMSSSVLGGEHPDTLTNMGNLASAYWKQRKWSEAEKIFAKVVEASKKVLGEEHPDTLISIANLASTYRSQGRWNEAEKLEVEVLDTRKKVLGERHPDTLRSTGNLASTYRNQGRRNKAEKLFAEVVEMRKEVLGEGHPDTLTSMADLSLTLYDLGQRQPAVDLMILCAAMSSDTLGADHVDTLDRCRWKDDWEKRWNEALG
ncbi:hypothetical protein LTR82_018020 [Friedmanniomyces endolithicus]|uniref:AAA+ ATPase domain-containing protein n=1 Tax=Friedmanniomyces endolithicus TaxID=329885 RepID=A0AAN6J094_9PEZI|nr:hypothetical protein LTR82_018020 [Friedmanniomyces endolithicus]